MKFRLIYISNKDFEGIRLSIAKDLYLISLLTINILRMIIKDQCIDGIRNIIVEKDFPDSMIPIFKGTLLSNNDFSHVINEDCDVYSDDGTLLLKLRKNVLCPILSNIAFDNLIDFAKQKTSTRGFATGGSDGLRHTGSNTPVMSNVIGYFDTWSVGQKHMFKQLNIKPPYKARVTSFTMNHPDKWNNIIPLIQNIDKQYQLLTPQHYHTQYNAAQSTPYNIPLTSFSTVTTNVNFQTACHTDKGDYSKGFGNLSVLEKGQYEGGYTVFPQYGIAINLRNRDFVAMNVHQLHGNTPIIPIDKDAVRLSLVCYLRENILRTTGCPASEIEENILFIQNCKQIFSKIKA